MGQTKITILCENTAPSGIGLTGEHGFAALIEKDGAKILLDTGQGLSLLNNARVLRINLAEVMRVVLSHGHFDHAGGLPQILAPPRGVEVIAHPDIFDSKYAEIESPMGKVKIFIGIYANREYLERALMARFNLITEFGSIAPGIFISGEVPRLTDFEGPDPRLMVERDGAWVPDPMRDDLSLMIETEKGPVVLLGCAHAGTVNILDHFAAKTGHRSFHAVIGGTHLGFLTGNQLEKTIAAFEDYGIELIAPSHCTGPHAAANMFNHFGEKFQFAVVGWSAVF